MINKLRPSSSRQKVYKKNIRKNKKANQNNDLKIKEEDHEDEEKSEKFKEIIEICDILSSNGCLGLIIIFLFQEKILHILEIFAQTKEEIIEFTNEKLKKNFLMDQNFVNSDNEFKNENDLSESD